MVTQQPPSATSRQRSPSPSSGTGMGAESVCQRAYTALAASDYVARMPASLGSSLPMSSSPVSRTLTSPRRVPSPARLLTTRRRHMCGEILARRLSGTVRWSALWVQHEHPVCLIGHNVPYRGLPAASPQRHRRSIAVRCSLWPGLPWDSPQRVALRPGHAACALFHVHVSGDIHGGLGLSEVNALRRFRHVLPTHYGRPSVHNQSAPAQHCGPWRGPSAPNHTSV